MAVDNSAKISLAAAIIGALGAIAGALIPIYLNRPAAEPVRTAARADVGPVAATSEPAAPDAKTELLLPVAKSHPPPHDALARPKPKAVDTQKKQSSVATSNAADVPKASGSSTSKADRKAYSRELTRLHGKWAVVEQTNPKKAVTRDELAVLKPVWEFSGNKLAVHHAGAAPGVVHFQGTIKLYPNFSPKGFDFTGKDRSDQPVELLGIYAFDGPELMIRYRLHHPGDAVTVSRPDSFKPEGGPRPGWLLRLRQIRD
jgi:uncharacterized protein (TIGR03067 family)